MKLLRALRLDQAASSHSVISLVGAGGKTTALFQLARQYKAIFDTRNSKNETRRSNTEYPRSIILTATSHLGVWQIPLADHHIIANDESDLANLPSAGVILVTGGVEGDRTAPVSKSALNWLRAEAKERGTPLLIEADGSRQKALKAPAAHEPAIPSFTDLVIHVSGLGALGAPLDDEHIHRAAHFSQLSGLPLSAAVTPQAVTAVLAHPEGGLKDIPPGARRIALLNQADTPELRSIGGGMVNALLAHFHAVVLGSLPEPDNFQTFEPVAGIILAAGSATRFGSAKQLLDWKGKPFVRHVAETALHAGLQPVVVVTGFHHADVESALSGLPVLIVHNPDYAQGQSTSMKAALSSPSLHPKDLGRVGAAIFLLADQPQIPVEVIRALTEAHTRSLAPILAPLVLEERRANPVLFDRDVFPDLMQVTGDVGGRAVFSKHKVEYLPWHDDLLLFDVDKPEDYQKLLNIGKD
ncbi:MAG: selenium cofactor biosynthesis protein YqeC [Anaerolineales bacterium]|nr:MAG: selenium cofactor biosynthesis protein YqeC [Anaerolineales bacterium]